VRLTAPIPIATAVAWLPPERETFAAAVAAGRADEAAERDGFVELPISRALHAPEMAVEAGRSALGSAGWTASTLDLVLHAWTHDQGQDFWSPAHFVASGVGARAAVPIGIQQMCNGGGMALELAAGRMLADPDTRRVLVTTADRFTEPDFDRWRSDSGIAYGDAATAVLLGGDGGSFLLHAITTVAAPELEAMHRGDEPFAAAGARRRPLDIRGRKRAFLAAHSREHVGRVVAACVRRAVDGALADAGISVGDVRAVLLPRLGHGLVNAMYRPAFVDFDDAVVRRLGARTGHLGAGDLAANLAHLCLDAPLAPGDPALLLSAGGGFTWTCAVLSGQ
jgi:3-oxoacyl-[acyl-carrier-protein] synthase-3